MVFEYDVPVGGPPGNPLVDHYHFNPPSPLGLWLSGPFSRPAGMDTLFRVGFPLYVDTNSNADWNSAASVAGVIGTPGAPNLPGLPGVATQGADLEYSAPAGPGSIAINITTGNPAAPGVEFYNLISLTPVLPCANGPIFGLAPDVIGIIQMPVGSPIFHDFLSPAGDYPVFIGGGVPVGIPIQSRAIINVGGTWSLSSNTVYYTT
jgi:hypothetical protein